MRALDIGCGRGEVSLLLAKMVGSVGEVIGIAQDENAIDLARERVKAESMSHVTFLKNDLCDPLSDIGLFDAAIGRRVMCARTLPYPTPQHSCF